MDLCVKRISKDLSCTGCKNCGNSDCIGCSHCSNCIRSERKIIEFASFLINNERYTYFNDVPNEFFQKIKETGRRVNKEPLLELYEVNKLPHLRYFIHHEMDSSEFWKDVLMIIVDFISDNPSYLLSFEYGDKRDSLKNSLHFSV